MGEPGTGSLAAALGTWRLLAIRKDQPHVLASSILILPKPKSTPLHLGVASTAICYPHVAVTAHPRGLRPTETNSPVRESNALASVGDGWGFETTVVLVKNHGSGWWAKLYTQAASGCACELTVSNGIQTSSPNRPAS